MKRRAMDKRQKAVISRLSRDRWNPGGGGPCAAGSWANIMGAHQLVEGRSTDTEQLGRPGDVALGRRQGLRQGEALGAPARALQGVGADCLESGLLGRGRQIEIAGRYQIRLAHQNGAADLALQLANVAGPVVALDQ